MNVDCWSLMFEKQLDIWHCSRWMKKKKICWFPPYLLPPKTPQECRMSVASIQTLSPNLLLHCPHTYTKPIFALLTHFIKIIVSSSILIFQREKTDKYMYIKRMKPKDDNLGLLLPLLHNEWYKTPIFSLFFFTRRACNDNFCYYFN